MRIRVGVVGVAALLLGVVLAGVAGACSCTDKDGCGSSLSCAGKSSDDACTPPKGGTCQVVSGFSGALTCCCSCRKPKTNATACSGFTDVKDSLATLRETAAPCSRAAKTATKATANAAKTTIGQAQRACQKNQAAKEEAKVDATIRTFIKFDGKVQKLLDKNKVTQGCRENLGALAQEFIIETRNAGTPTVPAPPAPPTTTTVPNPPSIVCSGLFTPFDPAECDYLFSCTGSGPSPFDAYGIAVTGRQLTNKIDPPGYTCNFGSLVTPNDSIYCQGAVPLSIDINGGRLHFLPNWTLGMGAKLLMYSNGSVAATYNMTGP
jgi:hypothetical protein